MELGTYFELEVSFGESELLAYILAVLYLALGLTALVSFSSSSLSLSLSLFLVVVVVSRLAWCEALRASVSIR